MFLFQQPAVYLIIPKRLECRGEGSYRHQFDSPCAVSCVNIVSAIEPCCQFVESNALSQHQPGLFGDFHWTPLANNLTECNPVQLYLANKKKFFKNKNYQSFILATVQMESVLLPTIEGTHYRVPSDLFLGKQPQVRNPDRQKPSFHTHEGTDQKAVGNAKNWFLGEKSGAPEKTTQRTHDQLKNTRTITTDMAEGKHTGNHADS